MTTLRSVTPHGLKFTEAEEAKVPFVYDDAKGAVRYKTGDKVLGTLTAGAGHVGADVNGWIGKTIPDGVIDEWLRRDMSVAETAVSTGVTVGLNDNQFDALCDFVFNAGVGAFRSSTLLKRLNQGHYDAVPAQFAVWVYTHVNGQKVRSAGLVKRRTDETLLWNTPVSAIPPALIVTPKEPEQSGSPVAVPVTPPVVTPENVSAATGIVGMFASFTTGPVAWAFAAIAVGAFSVLAYYFVTKRLFPR